MKLTRQGFTLVELLVVISIISILSIIGLVVFTNVQYRGRESATLATLDAIRLQIEQQRISQGATLLEITGSGCTECVCRGSGFDPGRTGAAHYVGQDYSNINSPACQNSVNSAFVTRLGMAQVPKDGWGDPIIMDENEGESGNNDCRRDAIHSIHGQLIWLPINKLPIGSVPCALPNFGG